MIPLRHKEQEVFITLTRYLHPLFILQSEPVNKLVYKYKIEKYKHFFPLIRR